MYVEISKPGYAYFGARYYSSELSVWLSVDPLSFIYPSVSPYMYVQGNPIRYTDPDGRWVKGTGFWKNITKSDNRINAENRAAALGGDAKAYRNKGGKGWNVSYTSNESWPTDLGKGGTLLSSKTVENYSNASTWKSFKGWWKNSTSYFSVEGNVTFGAQLGAKVKIAGASVALYGNLTSQTVLSGSATQTSGDGYSWNFDGEYLGDDDNKTMTGGGSINLIGGYEYEEKYQLAWKGDNYGKTTNMTTSHTVNVLLASYTKTNHAGTGKSTHDGKIVVGAKVAAIVGFEIKVTFGRK
jgi:RHS repeat-associated protein